MDRLGLFFLSVCITIYAVPEEDARNINTARLVKAIRLEKLDEVESVLEAEPKPDVNAMIGYVCHETPLIIAAKIRSNVGVEIIRKLIAAGAQVDRASKRYLTPLIAAIEAAAYENVRQLVEAGAAIHSKRRGQLSILMKAVSTSRFIGFTYEPDEFVNNQGVHLPLSDTQIIELGQAFLNIVSYLLQKGVDPNMQDSHGQTAIALNNPSHQRMLTAVMKENRRAMMRVLLEGGANPNKGEHFDETALAGAALSANTDAVKLLLAHHAEPNQPNRRDGMNALMLLIQHVFTIHNEAEIKEKIKIINLLLPKTNLKHKNSQDETIFDLIMHLREFVLNGENYRKKIAQLIINFVLVDDIPQRNREHPFINEVIKEKEEATRELFELIKEGVVWDGDDGVRNKINRLHDAGYMIASLRDQKGENILHAAFTSNTDPEVKRQLAAMFSKLIDCTDNRGYTPLKVLAAQHDETLEGYLGLSETEIGKRSRTENDSEEPEVKRSRS